MVSIRIDKHDEITKNFNREIIGRYINYRKFDLANNPASQDLPRRYTDDKSQKYYEEEPTWIHYNSNNCDNKRLVEIFNDEFKQNCLTADDFTWLGEYNHRLYHYIWRWIGHLFFNSKNNEIQFIPTFTNDVRRSVEVPFIKFKHSNKIDVIDFFNRLDCAKKHKLELINKLRHDINITLKYNKIERWLNKEQDKKTTWAYDYLKTLKIGYKSRVSYGSDSIKDDIISFFDIFFTIDEYKAKFYIEKMTKTWTQRKHREKNKSKKTYSINMGRDIGNFLNEMCSAKNEPKNAFIERLIRAEYKNFLAK